MTYGVTLPQYVNSSLPEKNGRHFTDDTFKCNISSWENVRIWTEISLNFVPKCLINNIPALNRWWLVYWRIYASLSLNEFMKVGCILLSMRSIIIHKPGEWREARVGSCFTVIAQRWTVSILWHFYLTQRDLNHFLFNTTRPEQVWRSEHEPILDWFLW